MTRFPKTRRRGGGLWSLILALVLAVGSAYWLKPNERAASGQAAIVDGDTIRLSGRAIRLKGIDTPELKQSCTLDNRPYRCGETARTALVGLIANRSVECRVTGRDRYGRGLGTCFVGGRNINAWLVSEGWAVSYGGEYRLEETGARLRGAGLWAGTFQRPQDWRREHTR
ncbi:thermonuclease family protein [Microvirga pudoricolor]|uniref:thermonuclease family protein n=1 Tax=Microvirga pudoricolor TaxID=2778729 RepID=UPI00194DC24E|nr:thermonuclease family protein [Microvirga pudoricolor]MBM6594645.1 thermonuclease family protein [Microvirga pudoricolor]